jgi:hypothetical protein
MNERIRELAEQAREFATTRHPVSNIVLSVNSEKFEEKFAELIVRECAAICQDVDGEDNIDARSGRQDCAVEIQEHFGVE